MKTKPLPPLTEKEKAVLAMIEESLADNGISPSYQEIRDHFGFASFNSVQNYLKQLTNKGYIQIPSHQKRAIAILHSANAVQDTVRQQRAQNPVPSSRMSGSGERAVEACELPLLGKVAAGQPLESFTHDEFVDVPLSLVRNPQKTFALQVAGQSMIDDGILDGDVILVQKQTTASNGEIVVATVDGESTVKRFYFQNQSERRSDNNSPDRQSEKNTEKKVELRPANSSMKSMWYLPHLVKIQGVVVGLIRKF
jgi:repressor LexA